MQILKMTYARVAAGRGRITMVDRHHDAGIDAYLRDHITALRKLASRGDAPLAEFTDPASERLFQDLLAGSDSAFLDAASIVANKLVAEMDGRTAPGLLLALRVVDARHGQMAAALKLQVVTEHAAVLEALDSGEEVLSAAANVLDAPGDLQKGALVPDRRPSSSVVVGDKLTTDALYFPRALGVSTEQRSADSASDLVNTINRLLPQDALDVARILPEIQPGRTEDVLRELGERLPTLDPGRIQQIDNMMKDRQRPVRHVDTIAPVTQVYEADGITISGPAQVMETASIEESGDGRWRITITTSEKPRVRFK